MARVRSTEGNKPSAWVLLAETRTVKVLGKRSANRDARTNQTDGCPDGNQSKSVLKRAGQAATEVVVAGRRHR